MTVTVITTFSDQNYKDYANKFVSSLRDYLDEDAKVVIYTDNPLFKSAGNWTNLILEESIPELTVFKNRNKNKLNKNDKKSFLKDAVRFAHKSYAIVHASRIADTDQLVWLDADTQVIAPLTVEYLKSFLPKGKFTSYLGRNNKYTETGWLSFDMNDKIKTKFFERWQWYYDSNVIYELAAQLDCHVFDAVRKEFELFGKIKSHNLSDPAWNKGHFDKSFAGVLTHHKGDRKVKWNES